MSEFDVNYFLNNNDLGYYYSEEQMNLFFTILESILRNKNEGQAIWKDKIFTIKLVEVKDK